MVDGRQSGGGGRVEEDGGNWRCETGSCGRLLSRDPSRMDLEFSSVLVLPSDGFDPWEYGTWGVPKKPCKSCQTRRIYEINEHDVGKQLESHGALANEGLFVSGQERIGTGWEFPKNDLSQSEVFGKIKGAAKYFWMVALFRTHKLP